VVEVDGHDPAAVHATLTSLPEPTSDKPVCVIAHTVKGQGVGYMELSRTWHLGYLAPADAAPTLEEIDQRA
jgi:transketolase